jgi:hypothetical protein
VILITLMFMTSALIAAGALYTAHSPAFWSRHAAPGPTRPAANTPAPRPTVGLVRESRQVVEDHDSFPAGLSAPGTVSMSVLPYPWLRTSRH